MIPEKNRNTIHLDKSINSNKTNNSKTTICKRLSGIYNTTFNLEEKLNQNKGNYNLFDSEENAKKNLSNLNKFKPLNETNDQNYNSNSKENGQSANKIQDKQNTTENLNENLEFDKNILLVNPNSGCSCTENRFYLTNKINCDICKKDLILNVPSLIRKSSKPEQKSPIKIIYQNSSKNFPNKQSASSLEFVSYDCVESSYQDKNISISSEPQIKKQSIFVICKGMIMAFISSIFFTLTAAIVKNTHDFDAGQMAIYRFAGMSLFSFPVLLETDEFILGPSNFRHWIILRGLLGASSLYLKYNALHYLPISNTTVISLSMPVFVCIFGRIFLKEKCGIFHFVSLAITLVGILLTSKTNILFGSSDESEEFKYDKQNEIYGVLSALGSAVIGASCIIILRKVKTLHYSVILFNYAWVSLLESLVITYTIHDGLQFPKDKYTPWFLVILSILSFYGQMLITKSLQIEEAALISVIRSSSEVIFSFIIQILLFREIPTLVSIFGALFVTSSVMLISTRKYIENLPDEHLARRMFWFTLK